MDLLNLSGDERLDLGDLTFALSGVPTGLLNELTGNFCLAPGEAAIITGFRPASSGATAVVVGEPAVPNVAFLGQRIAATVTPGVLTMEGPATQTVSTATLPAATYTVYIRFNRIPGVSQTRKFWAKALPGSEYSQLAETRQVATWEVRLSTSSPSAEWVPIATAVVTASGAGQGNTVIVTDTRLLYFEGRVDQGCVPVWGSATDRTSDRTVGNTGSLRQQLDAVRACLVDLKGRGLAKWYQPNISGMLIGTAWTLADLPQPNQLNIADRNFYFQLLSNQPVIAFDGANDYYAFNRGAGALNRFRGGTSILSFGQGGATTFGTGLSNGFVSANQPANANQYGISTYTTSASIPASIGIQSLAAKSAILELGPNGYGSSYAFVRSTWTATPSLVLGVNNNSFMTASSSGIGVFADLSFRTNSVNISTGPGGFTLNTQSGPFTVTAPNYSFGGRLLPLAMLVWSAGVYIPGSSNADQTGVTGSIANSVGVQPSAVFQTDDGGHNTIRLTFPSPFPSQASFILTGSYSVGSGKVYQCGYQVLNSNTLIVGIANAADNPNNQQFTFYVYYGS